MWLKHWACLSWIQGEINLPNKKRRKINANWHQIGKKHYFPSYNILWGQDQIEVAQILGSPEWEFEIVKLLFSYESCDFGGSWFPHITCIQKLSKKQV
jgi:hypothetical protein